MKSITVVDLFRTIVEKTAEKFDFDINYLHGHPLEITSSLTELTQSPTLSEKRYPGIFLFQDFNEEKGGDFTVVDLNLIIGINTDNTLKAPDRYVSSFTPYLYPIYDAFLEVIARSGFFAECNVSEIKHTKIDRLYWGRNGLYGNTGNVFNDYIDCIEIKNLKLKVKPLNCK
jgi:hypothetical protein